MKDWTCVDLESLIREQLARNAYPKLMHQELSTLLQSFDASRRQ